MYTDFPSRSETRRPVPPEERKRLVYRDMLVDAAARHDVVITRIRHNDKDGYTYAADPEGLLVGFVLHGRPKGVALFPTEDPTNYRELETQYKQQGVLKYTTSDEEYSVDHRVLIDGYWQRLVRRMHLAADRSEIFSLRQLEQVFGAFYVRVLHSDDYTQLVQGAGRAKFRRTDDGMVQLEVFVPGRPGRLSDTYCEPRL